MLMKFVRGNHRQFRRLSQPLKFSTTTQNIEKPPNNWFLKFLGFGILSSAVGIGFYQFTKKPSVKKEDVKLPDSDKLLPDWPYPDQDIPPGMPPLPLLVLDLERTLIGSDYDSDHGWRHVKRPGLEKFIKSLAYQYYEIVIFSENELMMIPEELFAAIDPNNLCHKFGSNKAETRDKVVLKRLDVMNRDIRKIILIDDNPESFQLCERNTLQVKPFFSSDVDNDTILLDLIPFLQALVHDGSSDFRETFDDLGTHDAEQAVIEYRMRLSRKKEEENERKQLIDDNDLYQNVYKIIL
jgi:import inner membrane translocase subunit TIM50